MARQPRQTRRKAAPKPQPKPEPVPELPVIEPRQTATKAHSAAAGGAGAGAAAGWLLAQVILPALPIEQSAENLQTLSIVVTAIVGGAGAWLGAYLPRNRPKL